jgi:von Willebrand factor type A domain.
MDEPKRTSALAGLLLFMEVLDNLNIDYAIIGFSDKPIIHKDFQIPNLSGEERKVLFDRISAYIPSGFTADADALKLAIDLLKEEPEDVLRLIIMITDGEGNINNTGKTFEELQEEAEDLDIEVVGIGIGEGITEVAKRYKQNIQVPSIEELPEKLSDLLKEK